MLATKETTKFNSIVAQFKLVIEKDLLRDKYNTKFIFDKLSNVNYRIRTTDYLKLHHAKWIGCTALHFAAEELDLEACNILFSDGANFTIKNSSGSTAFHQLVENKPNLILEACTLDDPFVHCAVSAHVKYKNFENPVNSNGLSHFHIACAVNNIEVVKGFLQSGISVDQTVKTDCSHFAGLSPLHLAAKNCAFEVAEILLLHGASVEKQDAKGMTPVHMVLNKRLEILRQRSITNEKLLLSSDMLLRLFLEKESTEDLIVIDDWGLSHFHVACTLKDSKIAESYLQKVVNINHAINEDSPLLPGYTALHFAALCNTDIVKLLMKHGANISAKNADGVTPFDICIDKCSTEDIYAVISSNQIWKNIMLSDGKTRLTDLVFSMGNPRRFNLFLKKISKNFNICESPLWPGYTPMHLAILFSKDLSDNSVDREETNLQILRNLYKQNPSMIYSKDVHGRTPFHLAFYHDKKSVLDLLLGFFEVHLDVLDQVDKDGLSYVHIASAKNEIFLLNRLLSMHKNVSAIYRGKTLVSPTIQSGSTALHFAVAHESTEAVGTLMDFGADVYAKDANDMTPIHLLLRKENRKLADVLLSLPDLKDSVVSDVGLSHLHVACFCGEQKHVKSLLDNGADINAVVTVQPNASLKLNEFPLLDKYAGHSLLLLACDGGQYNIANVLFEHGAKILVDSSQEIELFYKTFQAYFGIFPDFFTEILGKNDDLHIRLLADTGITALHYACFTKDDEYIEKSLSRGLDPNERIRSDAPIFRGYTALHALMHVSEEHDDDDVDRVIELLLKAGADVTLQNGNSETAVHMVFDDFANEANYKRVNKLLEAQRDFSVNPINVSGYSHFHIACSICNNGIVEKFLTHGDIDVNQPIDFFSKNAAGYTALQFAAGNEAALYGSWKQLHTVDLLLKHEADVHAEDKYGDTPLHECARFGFLDVFERLVRGGSDVNARNMYGHTPLHYYIGSDNVSPQGIITLLRLGCRLNVFDAMNGAGYVGKIVDTFSYANLQDIVSAVTINFKRELEADSSGRTIIHNMVSTSRCSISAAQYTTLIEQLSEMGCDVDDQDNLGRTPLHMAASFDNFKAVSALLMAGADINVTDFNGKTAFPCDLDNCDECMLCSTSTDDSDSEDSEDDEDDKLCNHLKTIAFLAFHVKKLQLCGIDVSKQNEDLAGKALSKYRIGSEWSGEFWPELEIVKIVRIEPHTLTLYDFLSENGAVADYPTMSQMKREDINKFFAPDRMDSLRIKFPELAEILALQYRKVRARPRLVEMAKNAVVSLIGFRMPEICSHFILVLLTNSELKNLIASARLFV